MFFINNFWEQSSESDSQNLRNNLAREITQADRPKIFQLISLLGFRNKNQSCQGYLSGDISTMEIIPDKSAQIMLNDIPTSNIEMAGKSIISRRALGIYLLNSIENILVRKISVFV